MVHDQNMLMYAYTFPVYVVLFFWLQVLDDDSVIQETKSQNSRLIDYFLKPEILGRLVEYVTVVPPEDVEFDARFKYVLSR